MTLPDDLTQRVAEAICAGLSPTNGALDGPCERCQRSASYAAAAVLRALPVPMKAEVTGNDIDRLRAEGWNDCLAAIAKLADDG